MAILFVHQMSYNKGLIEQLDAEYFVLFSLNMKPYILQRELCERERERESDRERESERERERERESEKKRDGEDACGRGGSGALFLDRHSVIQ